MEYQKKIKNVAQKGEIMCSRCDREVGEGSRYTEVTYKTMAGTKAVDIACAKCVRIK